MSVRYTVENWDIAERLNNLERQLEDDTYWCHLCNTDNTQQNCQQCVSPPCGINGTSPCVPVTSECAPYQKKEDVTKGD